MRRYDGICSRCSERPKRQGQPYCGPCKTDYMREKRNSTPREQRAFAAECSKAPAPPPGFDDRDRDAGRPWE